MKWTFSRYDKLASMLELAVARSQLYHTRSTFSKQMAAKKNIPRKVDLSKQMENARTDARVDNSGELGVRTIGKTQRGARLSVLLFHILDTGPCLWCTPNVGQHHNMGVIRCKVVINILIV